MKTEVFLLFCLSLFFMILWLAYWDHSRDLKAELAELRANSVRVDTVPMVPAHDFIQGFRLNCRWVPREK